MKRKISTLLLIFMLITSIIPCNAYVPDNGATIGGHGSIPGGGTTGKGGGICKTPCFRVGIISEEFREPLNYDDKYPIPVNEQIEQQYVNHFPRMSNSIIFCPPDAYVDNSVIKWYNSSSSNLDPVDSQFNSYKLRKLGDSYIGGDIFYEELKNKLTTNQITDLAGGKWLEVLDINSASECQQVWNYILKDWSSENNSLVLQSNLNSFTHFNEDSIQDHEKLANQLGYLQLLMTLYVLAPPPFQDNIYKTIERYIIKDDVLTNPPIVAIDTVVRVSAPDYSSKYMYIPCVDYMMFVSGVTAANHLTSPTAPAFDTPESEWEYGSDHTRTIIKNLVNKSISDAPNWKRITSYYGNAFKYNGFAWGQSGVIGKSSRIYTGSGSAEWKTTQDEITGIMEALTFKDSHYGFVLVSAYQTFAPPDNPTGGFSITTDAPSPEMIKEENATVIGDVIKITLKGNINNLEKDAWNKQLSYDTFEAGYPKIKLDLEVMHPSDSAYSDILNSQYQLTTTNNCSYSSDWQYIDKDDLLGFITGKVPLEYIHEVMDYPVEPSSSYTFKYKSSIEVQLSSKKKAITLNAIPTNTGQKTFNTPDPTSVIYTIPTYASEIKQGRPYGETFEAMAGTPTTRDLYFATGGSEFIIEIHAKYCKDQKIARTYKSKFSGTPCEFQTGDQAGSYTLPSPSGANSSDTSVNVHGGDLTISATWTGSLPWTGSVSYWDHGTSVTNSWDYSNYETAKSQAQDWISTISNYEISHTAASDKETRTFNNWNAHITTDSRNDGPSGDADPGQEYIAPTPPSGDPPTGGDDGQDYVAASGHDGGPGNYTITVTGSIPAHILCGPCHTHELPAVEDTWKQELTYDTAKITNVNVWKIHRSMVNGMITLLDTDEVTADIVQGDPNIFYNIAKTESSKDGRIRYSLEPQQHDTVVWDEGIRTNKCNGLGSSPYVSGSGHNSDYAHGILYTNNSYSTQENYHKLNADNIDKQTEEYNKFDSRRNMENKATVISDFVILQTSSGDQSLLYFDKESEIVKSQQQFQKVASTFDEMWLNNPESCAKWLGYEINVGSYNGEFFSPKTKYNGTGDKHKTMTILDDDPAHTIIRPPRPSQPLRIVKTGLDIKDTISNGEYITGTSSVFYKNILSTGKSSHYQDEYNPDYGESGLTYETKYQDSENFTKINDIVIHNPVSAESAIIYPIDSSMDQRVFDNDNHIGGNLQPDITEYVTKLKEIHPYQNFIYNGNAEETTPNGNIVNWIGEVNNKDGVTFKRIESNDKIAGKGSFYIEVPAKSNRIAKYVTTSLVEPNINYSFTGMMKCHNCFGNFLIEALDSNDNVLDTWSSESYSDVQTKTMNISFRSPANTAKLRVNIINGNSNNTDNTNEYIIADNLSITKENGDTCEWVPNKYTIYEEREMDNPDYVNPYTITNPEYIPEKIVKNPNYVPPINVPQQNIYSGSYTFKNPATVRVNLYGAGGGYYQHLDHEKYYTNSQYGNGIVYVDTGDILSWNGTNLYKNNSIIASYRYGTTSGRSADSCADAERLARNNGGSVSNYALSNFSYSGSSSNYFTVPAYNQPGNGEPEYITIPAVGEPTILINNANYEPAVVSNGVITPAKGTPYIPDLSPTLTSIVKTEKTLSQPPDDWYETILEVIPANPNIKLPDGNTSSGDMLMLDYPFKIYFPNEGDFYGNGALGLAETSEYRGKGFTDNMDTTEWTSEKIAKFDYNVIYNNVLYPAGSEISLYPINQEWYHFYLPLANKEAISAGVKFYAVANNGSGIDNTKPTNKKRYNNKNARHSALKQYNIDIVGRIGNLVMEDTGDFRFSNIFKKPVTPTDWYIPNVVPKVQIDQQNNYIGNSVDIRGESASPITNYLNTYGCLDFLQKAPLSFPLSPSINNIEALKRQPLRVGYPIFMDIQTIGNYYSYMQIIPYYYGLNLNTGELTPLDVYMEVDKKYQPINIFGGGQSILDYPITLNWEEESARRNYLKEEQDITEFVRDNTYNVDSQGNEIPIGMPIGKYHTYGNAQFMQLNERNRTFIGTPYTYGMNRNPGNLLSDYAYNQQAQRWHFTFKLPSSTIFVPHGSNITNSNLKKIMNDSTVVIAAANIKAIGDTYCLQYKHHGGNGSVTLAGKTHSLDSIPYSVYAVYSSEKSSSDDLSTSGTH
ncbi:hypothetical protein [Vallitalea maricola]|uniref:Uncharacterized protein n=1 Tax=Vallitalea maricola TaxID=3074433 RepID=A0ACB5UM08_9FIRM|nr:hypothetical protein AN2V17_27920 [Vallitalea sp. AN17-2]